MKEDVDILYHGEVQLLDYGETRGAGKYLKIRLSEHDDDPLRPFRGMDTATAKRTGHVLHVTVATGDIAKIAYPAQERDGGSLAQELDARNVWADAALWSKLCFTPDDRSWYRRWVADQGCCVCGQQGEAIHPHHWRDLTEGAGMGLKVADYWCIGLCFRHHTGDLGVHSSMGVKTWLQRIWYTGLYAKFHPKYVATNILMAKWTREAFKNKLHVQSLRDVTARQVADFEEKYGIELLRRNHESQGQREAGKPSEAREGTRRSSDEGAGPVGAAPSVEVDAGAARGGGDGQEERTASHVQGEITEIPQDGGADEQ